MSQNGFIFPNYRGENNKCLKRHQPGYINFGRAILFSRHLGKLDIGASSFAESIFHITTQLQVSHLGMRNPPRPSPKKTVALKGTNWYPAMFGLGLKHGISNSWQILGNLWYPLLNFRGTLDGIMDAEAVDVQHIQFQISTVYTLHIWNTSLLILETIMAMATSFRTEPSSNCSKVHKKK